MIIIMNVIHRSVCLYRIYIAISCKMHIVNVVFESCINCYCIKQNSRYLVRAGYLDKETSWARSMNISMNILN